MIVDDRLETVLRTVAAGPGAIRTQFRQLADLLGRTPTEAGSPEAWTATHVAALGRIDVLHAALGDAASGALLRTCTLRSPVLVEHFADAGPKVALAAITSARLHEAEWLQLIPDLPVQARGFLRHRRDLGPAVQALLARFGITDFALPLPPGFEPLATSAPSSFGASENPSADPIILPPAPLALVPAQASVPTSGQDEGIGAIVRRIEAFRRARAAHAVPTPYPAPYPASDLAAGTGQTRLPFADEPLHIPRRVTALDLRIDAEGTVIGADAAYAAMLVGLRPFVADPDAPVSCDAASIGAARARRPVAAGFFAIEGAGQGPDSSAGASNAAVAGSWRIDAVPLFVPGTGHFQGYAARLRRPPTAPAITAANDDDSSNSKDRSADRLRQMLHELRTPINAIQGFSELIQQQLLGPTPHQYRSLAASIASDAARMLAGFEDIERLAALESGQLEPRDGDCEQADFAALLTRLLGQLEPVLAPREIKLCSAMPNAPLIVATAPAELERTLWRLLSVIASAAAPGERLALSLTAGAGQQGDMAHLALPLPAALAMRDDAALMAPDGSGDGPGGGLGAGLGGGSGGGSPMLGGGFALRLAAAEVRASGGTLSRSGARLDIMLPLLTAAHRTPSHIADPAGRAG